MSSSSRCDLSCLALLPTPALFGLRVEQRDLIAFWPLIRSRPCQQRDSDDNSAMKIATSTGDMRHIAQRLLCQMVQ